jgi:septal ring factor EnvC (AmiA/AmiB activator)
MPGKLNLALYCLLLLSILGCASKADLELVSSDLELVSSDFELVSSDLERVSRDYRLAQEQIRELHQRIQTLEEEKVQCEKALAKNESIISVQGRVIKLIDDPKQTLQKSIQEQLLEQNIEIDPPVSNP